MRSMQLLSNLLNIWSRFDQDKYVAESDLSADYVQVEDS